MARIPTNTPNVDKEGYVSNGKAITMNETVAAVNKNEPLFGVGDSKLQGYVALELYEQHQANVIQKDKLKTDNIYELFNGQSYASGQPFVTQEAVWVTNVAGVDADKVTQT